MEAHHLLLCGCRYTMRVHESDIFPSELQPQHDIRWKNVAILTTMLRHNHKNCDITLKTQLRINNKDLMMLHSGRDI